MKTMLFALAFASLAASPVIAQPQRARAPVPGAHDVPGEIVLYAAGNFSGQSQRVTGAQARLSTPFAIRSLSVRPGDRWEICANADFRPPCTILNRPIADAGIVGIQGQIGSIRLLPDPNAPTE